MVQRGAQTGDLECTARPEVLKIPGGSRTKRRSVPKRCYQFVLIILTKGLHTSMKGFGVGGVSAARKLHD